MNETFRFGYRDVGIWNVTYSAFTRRFSYGDADVTELLSRAQKVEIAGGSFDVEAANREASDAARDAAGLPRIPEGETSVAVLWAEGVAKDVNGLAKKARSLFGLGEPGEDAPPGTPPIIKWALFAGVLFVLWRIGAFDWIKRRLAA